MKSLGSLGNFLCALLLVLLALICMGNSYKQELWLYDALDNAHLFHSHVSDMSDYNLLLPKVTRVCRTGVWVLFDAPNFETHETWLGSHIYIYCTNFTTAASVRSLRYMGANDTDTDALSLYEGPSASAWSGKEILVTARARTGITNQILGIAGTGTSDWMLFEGQDLDGKSACFKPSSDNYVNWNTVIDLNLTTTGSVFKGCDVQEIQKYKTLQKSSFVSSKIN